MVAFQHFTKWYIVVSLLPENSSQQMRGEAERQTMNFLAKGMNK